MFYEVSIKSINTSCLTSALWEMLYKTTRSLTQHTVYCWLPTKHGIETHQVGKYIPNSKKINSCLPLNDAAWVIWQRSILKLFWNWILEPVELHILMGRLLGKAGLHLAWRAGTQLVSFLAVFQRDKRNLNNCCVNWEQLLNLRGLKNMCFSALFSLLLLLIHVNSGWNLNTVEYSKAFLL